MRDGAARSGRTTAIPAVFTRMDRGRNQAEIFRLSFCAATGRFMVSFRRPEDDACGAASVAGRLFPDLPVGRKGHNLLQ